MKVLGIDISSKSTGWGLLEDGKLLEYGKINPTGKMSQAQKLHLFDIELNKIIAKCEPDEIAIEDVIHVKAINTTKVLARFNGIAIKCAYAYTKKDPTLMEPSKWKKVLDGCNGSAKKAEIQVCVCRQYNLLSEEKIEYYVKQIENAFTERDSNLNDDNIKQLRKDIVKAKRKKDTKLKEMQNLLSELVGARDKLKKENKKVFNMTMDTISMSIYADSGLNEDEADAIGVANFMNKLIEE